MSRERCSESRWFRGGWEGWFGFEVACGGCDAAHDDDTDDEGVLGNVVSEERVCGVEDIWCTGKRERSGVPSTPEDEVRRVKETEELRSGDSYRETRSLMAEGTTGDNMCERQLSPRTASVWSLIVSQVQPMLLSRRNNSPTSNLPTTPSFLGSALPGTTAYPADTLISWAKAGASSTHSPE